MDRNVLTLNKSFYAIHVINWEKAMSLLYQGAAQAVDENMATYDFDNWCELSKLMETNDKGFINTTTMRIAVPEVIRLTRYDKLPRQEVKFSRSNVYQHYGFKCCYCGGKFSTKELNLDHVVPQSKGGSTTWHNIVTSCVGCNVVKDDHLIGKAEYPGAAKLSEMGYAYLRPLAGKKMTLLVKPSKPRWKGAKTVTMHAPLPIPVSWQNLVDRKYWDSELKP